MFSTVCVAFFVLICQCWGDQCHEGMVKFTKDSKLSCINGTWVGQGCQTEDGQQLDNGMTMVKEPFLFQCQKGRDDVMRMVTIGCYKNGRILAPTQTLETVDSYYTCVPKTGGVSFQLSGCAAPRPHDRRVPFDTTVQVGNSVFKCILKGSTSKLEPTGCVHNNQTYMVGDKIVDDDYWYVCEKGDENGAKLTTKGCVNDLMPLKEGDIFHSQGIIYECQNGANGFKSKITGCLEITTNKNIVEHNIGDGWTEGAGDQRIQYQCTENGPVVSSK